MTDLSALIDLHKKSRDNSADQISTAPGTEKDALGPLGLSGTRIGSLKSG